MTNRAHSKLCRELKLNAIYIIISILHAFICFHLFSYVFTNEWTSERMTVPISAKIWRTLLWFLTGKKIRPEDMTRIDRVHGFLLPISVTLRTAANCCDRLSHGADALSRLVFQLHVQNGLINDSPSDHCQPSTGQIQPLPTNQPWVNLSIFVDGYWLNLLLVDCYYHYVDG